MICDLAFWVCVKLKSFFFFFGGGGCGGWEGIYKLEEFFGELGFWYL